MASGAQTFSKMLKLLRENSSAKEKREALTYIRSNSKKLESTNAIKEDQYKELCKFIIDAFSNGDDNTQHEAYETLSVIIREFKDHALNLFDAMLHANRKSRLKLIKLLEILDDNAILTLKWDTSAVNFFKDCMQNVHSKSMEWLSPNACTDDLKVLTEAETRVLSPEQKFEEEIINHAMTFMKRLYKVAVMTSDLKIEKFDTLLMDKVVLMAYMGHKRQREPALKLLHQALVTDIAQHIRKDFSDVWTRYKNSLQTVYCKRMLLLVGVCEVDWALQWNLSIQLLGTDLHKGAGLINNLLSVEEKAFKSTDSIIRRQAFLSWKLLVDNFALDPQELATPRRIKLLCIPLNAKNSKTELIALTKVEVWWHVIVKLYKDITPFSDPMITQFLNFCFGPLGDTPLLSSKCNLVASPGKRFYKTKVVAVDALCQLLVSKSENQNVFSPFLEERLPHSMTDAVFQECYKSVIHSVGEALLILSQLTDSEMKSRYQLAKVFWKTLIHYVQETNSDKKDLMYQNIVLVIIELMNYAGDKPLIKELFLDTIWIELSKCMKYVNLEHNAILDLISHILSSQISLMRSAKKEHYDALERILWYSIKPKTNAPYRPNSLEFLRKVYNNLCSSLNEEHHSSTIELELWKILMQVLIKYVDDSQDINEGNAAEHNFETIELILMFPFEYTTVQNPIHTQEIARMWKIMYTMFEVQAEFVPTVKPNEILSKTVDSLLSNLTKNKQHSSLIVNCLEALLSSINYKVLLGVEGVPSILQLIINLAITSFTNKEDHDCETVLKALSAVLITVYGHNAEKVIAYLFACNAVIKMALKSESSALAKEISNMWETVVSIFKGLGKLLTYDLLACYKDAIVNALNHANLEIELQALYILELKDVNSNVAALLETLTKKMRKNKPVNKSELIKKKKEVNGKVAKPTKVVGSFLGKGTVSCAPTTGPPEREMQKTVLPEPDSQDYVLIKTELKFDINRLTEHQKENLKRRRDDIPALYNDLSQSSSQDTQNLQEWFDRKSKHIADLDKTSALTQNILDNDANKENKIVTTASGTADKSIAADSQIKAAANISDGTVIEPTQDSTVPKEKSCKESDTTGKILDSDVNGDEPVDEISESKEENTAPNLVVKKLDFESRDEFPDDKTGESRSSPSLLDNGKRRLRRIMPTKLDTPKEKVEPSSAVSVIQRIRRVKGVNGKSTGQDKEESSPEVPSSEPKSSSDDTRRGVKRKAGSDSETEGQNTRRARKLNGTPNDQVEDVASSGAGSLSQRTKSELSRLQINMVFDSPLPVRRRSKVNEDAIKESAGKTPGSRNHSPENKKAKLKLPEKESKPSQSSGQNSRGLGRLRKKSLKQDTETDLLPSDEKIETKPVGGNTKQADNKSENVNNAVEKTLTLDVDTATSDTVTNKSLSKTVVLRSDSNTTKKETETKESMLKESKESQDSSTKEKSTVPQSVSPEKPEIQDDGEDVIESSQDTSEYSKTDRKYKDKQYIPRVNKSVRKSMTNDSVPETFEESSCSSMTESPNKDDPVFSETDNKKTEKPNELTEQEANHMGNEVEATQGEEDRRTTNDTSKSSETQPSTKNPLVFSSPKASVKRFTKFKPYSPQGRAAHMLGLVTKQSKLDFDSQIVSIDEELSAKKVKSKDTENETAKKDRPSTPTSASSSRQEKMFNNMKSTEFLSPTSIRLFSNLKNDGEKVSPRLEKSAPSSETGVVIDNQGEKRREGSASPPTEKEELPILEWSSANPPSLTASPSASILKRHRSTAPEPDPECITPSKRKRVSFADPPVSKEMGYQIVEPSSPHRLSKLGSSRSSSFRRDSPFRLRHPKSKLIPIDPESQLLKENGSNLENNDMDLQFERENELLSEIAEELEYSVNAAENMNMDIDMNSTEADSDANNSNLTDANTRNKVTIDDLTCEVEIAETQNSKSITSSMEPEKTDDQTDKIDTQQDMFSTKPNDIYSENVDQEKSLVMNEQMCNGNASLDSLPLNESVVNTMPAKDTSENLEDTVDANNLTGIDSSANSDEIFCGKPVRTSTQAADNVGEQDTLPVTDSLFGSQESQMVSQFSMDIPRPELLDSTQPIYPSLSFCKESVKSIVGQLTNPLWTHHLSTYLASRNLRTVGDLAQLTEREVNRIPIKGNSKVDFMRSVLKRFETLEGKQSSITTNDKLDMSTADGKSIGNNSSSMTTSVLSQEMEVTPQNIVKDTMSHSTPLTAKTQSKAPGINFTTDNSSLTVPNRSNQSTVSTDLNCDKSFGHLVNDSTSATTSTSKKSQMSTLSAADIVSSSSNIANRCTCGAMNRAAVIVSVGTCTDPVSPIKSPRKATKSVEAQMELGDLLDEIDVQLVLESAARRCTPEKLLSEYKNKMKHVADTDLELETIRLLGLEIRQNYKDVTLKAACRACGVTKVLSRLPDIFSNDKNFFSKVLSTYCQKLKTSDCINVLNFSEVKSVVSQKCTSSELAEMLSEKLQEEERDGIKKPLTDLPSLDAIFKRMPTDVIISHTVANEELISSRLVLDIALENNSSDSVADILRQKPQTFTKKIFDKLWVSKFASEHITKNAPSRDELLDIFKAVSAQLNAEDLLTAYHDAMKEKL